MQQDLSLENQKEQSASFAIVQLRLDHIVSKSTGDGNDDSGDEQEEPYRPIRLVSMQRVGKRHHAEEALEQLYDSYHVTTQERLKECKLALGRILERWDVLLRKGYNPEWISFREGLCLHNAEGVFEPKDLISEPSAREERDEKDIEAIPRWKEEQHDDSTSPKRMSRIIMLSYVSKLISLVRWSDLEELYSKGFFLSNSELDEEENEEKVQPSNVSVVIDEKKKDDELFSILLPLKQRFIPRLTTMRREEHTLLPEWFVVPVMLYRKLMKYGKDSQRYQQELYFIQDQNGNGREGNDISTECKKKQKFHSCGYHPFYFVQEDVLCKPVDFFGDEI